MLKKFGIWCGGRTGLAKTSLTRYFVILGMNVTFIKNETGSLSLSHEGKCLL